MKRLDYPDERLNNIRAAADRWLAMPIFTTFKFAERGGKATKVPDHPHGTKGITFDAALKAFNRDKSIAGLGIKLGPIPGTTEVLFGVDYDGAAKGRLPDGWPKTDTYAERSPSGGDKFHILGLYEGEPLEGKRSGAVEVYCQGRFFTLTGERINGAVILETDPRPFYAAIGCPDPQHYGAGSKVTGAAQQKVDPNSLTAEERMLSDGVSDSTNPDESARDFAVLIQLVRAGASDYQASRILCARSWRPKLSRGDYIARTLRAVHEDIAKRQAFHVQTKAIGEGADVGILPARYDLQRMLAEAVYISDGSQVALRSDPRFALSLSDFQNMTAASVTKGVPGSKGGRPTSVARAWLSSDQRVTVDARTFKAGAPLFCQSPDDMKAINTWREPPRMPPPADWQERAVPFFAHVAFLVSDATEREEFIDWLAHIEQRPGMLPHFHYLMFTKRQGVGRNLLTAILARVWPGVTAPDVNLVKLLDGGFNGGISRKILAVVNELREGGGGATSRKRAEAIKSYLTDSLRRINPKYGREYVEFNATRWLMFSNHENALPLDVEDRRVVVIENPAEAQGDAYYTALYALADEPAFIASIREALRVRDISHFNPGKRATSNAAKAKVIEASMSEPDLRMRELISTYQADLICSEDLLGELYPGADLGGSQHASLRYVAGRAGAVRMPRKVYLAKRKNQQNKDQRYLWILRNPDKWLTAERQELEAEVQRGCDEPAGAGEGH